MRAALPCHAESAKHQLPRAFYQLRCRQLVLCHNIIVMTSCDLDYALALSLQEQFSREQPGHEEEGAKSETEVLPEHFDSKLIVDGRWELLDPHPNVHDLFLQFDGMFFDRRLVNAGVEVRWSPRMTLCAGVCSYEGRGGLCSVRLSIPLLKLRPRKDLVETLLHEMIHALLFVTENNTDHDGHGPNFCHHMNRINSLSGANITIYHTFHEEVKQYRQHWWRCNGPCRNRPPFYGWVKRAMNRAPSPRDRWWNDHQHSCGGSYSKVKEPEGYGEKTAKKAKVKKGAGGISESLGNGHGCKDIQEMLGGKSGEGVKSETGKLKNSHNTGASASYRVFGGDGHKLLTSSNVAVTHKLPTSQDERRKKLLEAVEKRHQLAQHKGVKRKIRSNTSTDSHDIRTFCQTTPTNSGKRPRLSPATPPTPHRHTDTHPVNSGQYTAYIDGENKTTCSPDSVPEMVQLEENGVGEDDHCVIDLSVTEEGGGEDGVVVIDDDDDDSREGESGRGVMVPLRMCPVCGRVNIPVDIINIHVAHCLDEDTAEPS